MEATIHANRITRLSELRFDRPMATPKKSDLPRRKDRPAGRRLVMVALASGLAAATFGAGFWFADGRANPEPAPAAASPAVAPPVPAHISASGYVVARREATVAAQITGQITSIAVSEGDRVAPGQLLARLDAGAARASLDNAQASIDARGAAIRTVAAEHRQAVRTQQRMHQLAERGFARLADVDESDARVAMLAARIEQARAEQSASRATARSAGISLSNFEIRAPFGGIVTSVNAQPGEMISPMSAGGGFTRTGICTIVDMSSLEIEADVNESYMPRVSAGQAVQVVLDAYPGRSIEGAVLAIVPSADRARGTFRVRISLNDHDGLALPNMAVKVKILTGAGAASDRTQSRRPDRAQRAH